MDLNQDAVLWAKTGDNREGQTVVAPIGVDLRVRWNNRRGEMVDKDGNVIAYDAMVITDRALIVGSIMWLGSSADFPGTAGVPESDLMEVIKYNMFKSLDGRNTRHESYLMRYTDTLPTS